MGVSAIVVTYNRLSLLKECLSNLLNQSHKLDHIFVINNNSSDGTKEYLKNLHNKYIISKTLSKNLGGAGGFSLGTKLAYEESNSEYFWLMDDDTMPSRNALKELCISANELKNKFGFLSSNVKLWTNHRATNVPVVIHNWSNYLNYSLIQIKEASFVSFFISRECVHKLGLPISEAFIWGDDTEYTTRISRVYPCFFVPRSIVYHKTKTNKEDFNENIFNETRNRIPFYKYSDRNTLYIDKKYFSFKRFLKDFVRISLILLEIPFKSKDYRCLRMWFTLKGLITGIFFNPTVKFPK